MFMFQFIFGAVIGSFLFASYTRLSTGGNLFYPNRSHCDSCSATLAWFDLVPIFSYLILRGHCRRCGEAIPVTVLLSELFFGSLLLSWQPTLPSTLFFLAGGLLFFMAVSDARHFEFPASYGYCLMGCAVLVYTFFTPHHWVFIFLIIVWLGLQFFEPNFSWIGSGDFDVFLCLLLLLGVVGFALLLLISSLTALVASCLLKRRRLPFIPFITISYLLVLIFLR